MWSDGRDGRGRAVGRMDGRQDFPMDRPPSSLAGANGEQSALTPRTARGLFLVCMSLALRSLLKNCLGVQNIVQKV